MANEFKIKHGFISEDNSRVINNFSATTYYSGSTELYLSLKSALSASKNPILLTAAGAWTPFTSGATGIAQVESSTNKLNYFVVDFLQSVQTYAEWGFVLPNDYTGGTIQAQFYWLANSTSTNSVVWGCQAHSFANGDNIDQAYGAAQTVTQANVATANTINVTTSTSAITIAGAPAAGQYNQIRVYRLGSGSDTLAATARLLAVKIIY